MLLQRTTPIWVTGKDGTSQHKLEGLVNMMRGGTRWEEIEVATTKEESDKLEEKRIAMCMVTDYMRNMSVEQVQKLAEVVQMPEFSDLTENYK